MVDHPVRTEVAGLTCAQWGRPDAPVVLALHGLTSTSQHWSTLAAALPEHRLIAPDLAGRGGSARATAPPGLAGHALTVAGLAEELGLADLVLIGHSMGAFLAPLVALALGDRVRRVVLADGGVPPERSLLVRGPVVKATFTMQTALLTRRYADPDAFVDATEARAIRNRPDLRPMVLGWAGYLLDATGHARIDRDRLIADAVDSLTGEPTLGALAEHRAPVHLLAASAGATDDAKPFLSDAALEAGRVLLPRLTTARIRANHLTLLAEPALAEAIDRP